MANVAVQVGRELAFDKEQLNTLYLSGLLHDIGKIGIDDQVLNKPGTLTPDEFEHIKTHTVIGHRILKDLKQLDQLLPVVLHHHEQWDGGGYPHQLAGEEIPLMARIVAVADAFDAMSSDRPYRPGMSWEKIREIFKAAQTSSGMPALSRRSCERKPKRTTSARSRLCCLNRRTRLRRGAAKRGAVITGKGSAIMLIYLTSYDLLVMGGLAATAAAFFVAFIVVR